MTWRAGGLTMRLNRRPVAVACGAMESRHYCPALITLSAWDLLSHDSPRPVMAHFSLLRASLEGATAARWFFEPGISADERAGRGYGADIADLLELKKIEALDPSRRPPGVGPTEHIAALKAEAEAAGVPIAAYRGRFKLSAIYGGYQSMSPGSGEYLYGILSAAAHGRDIGRHLARRARLQDLGGEPREVLIMNVHVATWTTRAVLAVALQALAEAETYAAR